MGHSIQCLCQFARWGHDDDYPCGAETALWIDGEIYILQCNCQERGPPFGLPVYVLVDLAGHWEESEEEDE